MVKCIFYSPLLCYAVPQTQIEKRREDRTLRVRNLLNINLPANLKSLLAWMQSCLSTTTASKEHKRYIKISSKSFDSRAENTENTYREEQ